MKTAGTKRRGRTSVGLNSAVNRGATEGSRRREGGEATEAPSGSSRVAWQGRVGGLSGQ